MVRLVWGRRGRHRVPVLAGGIAYFALLSAAPTFTLLAFFGSRALSQTNQIHDYVFEQIEGFLGEEGVQRIEEIVLTETQSWGGGLALGLAVVVALWSASLVFTRMKDAVDLIWDVTPAHQRGSLTDRLVKPIERIIHRWGHPRMERYLDRGVHALAGLGVWGIRKGAGILTVMGLGVVMVVVVTSVTIVARVESWIPEWVPSSVNMTQLLVWLVGLLMLGTGLFVVFLVMPATRVSKRAALWTGFLTGAAMAALNVGVGAYLGWASGQGFGATASALLALMLWMYLEVTVLLTGVELCRAWQETSCAQSG